MLHDARDGDLDRAECEILLISPGIRFVPEMIASDHAAHFLFHTADVWMPKAITEIRSLARSRTKSALDVLIAVMRNTKSPPAARIAAANAILDRGWGKPPQAIHNGDDGALELIHRIERVIVHPENPDSEDI